VQAASPGRAQREYEAGQYDQAKQAYEQLLERRPDDPRLLYNAGTSAYQAQDFTNAIRVLGKATTAADLELQQRALFNLGDALYRRGEQVPDRQSREDLWRQAVQNFEASLKLNPQDADAEFNRRFVERKIEELKQQEPPPPESQQPDDSQQPKDSEQSGQSGQSKQPETSERSEQSQPQPSQPPDPSQRPEPSEQSEQPGPAEQQQPPEPKEQPGAADPSESPSPSEPPSSEPQPGEMPPRGEMTQQEAKQMLDAARQEERPMIFQPSDKERKRQNRVFKDW
jgi:Ca-activated chloride channel family protein